MEAKRDDDRTPNQLRKPVFSRNVLHRAHGMATWSQRDTKVIVGVHGPKAGTKKNENPEKAFFEVIWKRKTGQIGYLLTLCSSLSIVVNDDGALLACAFNATCIALVDAGIPMKHLTVAICCCLTEDGSVILDPTKLEEQKLKAFAYLVFPNTSHSTLPKKSLPVDDEPMEHGIITSLTHGVMSVEAFLSCLERGRAATATLSDCLRSNLQPELPTDLSKAG